MRGASRDLGIMWLERQRITHQASNIACLINSLLLGDKLCKQMASDNGRQHLLCLWGSHVIMPAGGFGLGLWETYYWERNDKCCVIDCSYIASGISLAERSRTMPMFVPEFNYSSTNMATLVNFLRMHTIAVRQLFCLQNRVIIIVIF